MNGVIAPEAAEECTYNRFVNTKGGLGRNIAADRYMEMINRDFKGTTIARRE
jgi:hypothetical protein